VNRTIATLTAVVALTLAACTSNTTTTTTDTRGWSDEAFRDVMAYCQATDYRSCAFLVTFLRDQGKCSLEATYRLVDFFAGSTPSPNDTPREAINDLLRDQLHPAGDCLGYFPT